MHDDRLLYKLLVTTVMLLLIVAAALPALTQDTGGTSAPIPDDMFELTGVLESISNQAIVLDGIPVDIRIADLNTRLTLGDSVRVVGSISEGVFTARSVGPPAQTADESSRTRDFDDNFEFRGVIDSIDDDFVIVSGLPVSTAALQNQVPLVVNQPVRVRGLLESGIFAAREIRLPNASGFFDDDFDDRSDDDDRDLAVPANCTVTAPAGWVSYTIHPGDTISSIAARSGSQVSELVRINCLDNPRFIIAGSSLILPRIPTSFPRANTGNESSGSRNFSSQPSRGNESSGSRSRSFPSQPSRGNESSGSNSNSNSASNS